MRLALFMATSGHSGVDRIVRNLVPVFTALDIDVDLLKVRGHGPELNSLPNGARVIDLGSSHVYGSLGAVVRYLRAERPTAMLSDKDRVNRIALLARDIAGVQTRIAVRTGTTVSVDLRDRGWLDRRIHYLSMHYRYPRAQAIIVPSEGAADDLADFAGLPRQGISVIANPVIDPGLRAQAAEALTHPWFQADSPPVVVGAGELCERKDFETLLRAFAQARGERPLRLVLLGRGKRRERLRAMADALGVGEDVDLPGFVANPHPYIARASLFVLSSRYEGFGNVLAEALAVGTPVVSTDCPSGPREILQGGRIGPLVPVGDSEAMAAAITRTLDAPPAKAALCAAAVPYEAERSGRRYLEVLGLRSEST